MSRCDISSVLKLYNIRRNVKTETDIYINIDLSFIET